MKKSMLALFAVFAIAVAQAATYRVTPDAPGGGNGLSWETPMTIDEAITTVLNGYAHGTVILCKAGVYVPQSTLAVQRNITMKGGLAGTDDQTLDPKGGRTVIDGNNSSGISPIFDITAGDPSVFERIEIRNAYLRGFDKSGRGGYPV